MTTTTDSLRTDLDPMHSPYVRRWRKSLAWIAALLLVSAASAVAYLYGQRAGVEALEASASHRLDVFRASFFAPVERYQYLPALLARYPAIIEALNGPPDQARRRQLDRFLQKSNAISKTDSIYVMDASGTTLASSNWKAPDSFVGASFAFRPYFAEAMQGRVGRFYGIGAVTGRPGYFLSQAVSHHGRIIGVIAVKIDLDTLDRDWEAESHQIAVTDDSGIVFLSSNRAWKYRSTKPLSAQAQQRLIDTRQYASMHTTPLDIVADPLWRNQKVVRIRDASKPSGSRRYLRLSRTLPDAKWTVTSFSEMEEAEAVALRHALAAGGSTAFLMLLAMLLVLSRRRIAEQEAARRAGDSARLALEAKNAELETLTHHLETMAISDPLTGCHNRRYFNEVSVKLVSAAQRYQRRISILMLDVDHFKKINDTWGHGAGDECLKTIAFTCSTVLREPDLLVRYGGEEFVAVLPDTAIEEAMLVAERLRLAIATLTMPGEAAIQMTVSIGVAEFLAPETSLDQALDRADAALYYAKRNGRNRIMRFAPELVAMSGLQGEARQSQ